MKGNKIMGYLSRLKENLPWVKKRIYKERMDRMRELTTALEKRERERQKMIKPHLNPGNIDRIIRLCKSGEMGEIGDLDRAVLIEVLKGRDLEVGWGGQEINGKVKECMEAYGKVNSYFLSEGGFFGEKSIIADIERRAAPGREDYEKIGDNIVYVARDLKKLKYGRKEVTKILHEGLLMSGSFRRMSEKGEKEKIKKIKGEINLALAHAFWKERGKGK